MTKKMDKSNWPRGEWDDEPDVLDWEQGGVRCHVERMEWGNLNGYVGVPPGHALHGASHNDWSSPNVHGGLTYSATRKDGWWYFGFGTAHYMDKQPGFPSFFRGVGGSAGNTPRLSGTYRNLEYVKKEVEKLATYITLLDTGATQLAEIFNDSSG